MLSVVRRQPSAILFAAQLAGVLVYPAMEDSEAGTALFSLFGIAILGLVVLSVRSSPGFTWVAIVLGTPATILLLIQAITRDDALLPYSSAFEAVLYFYAAGALIVYVLEDHVVTRDEVSRSAPPSRSWPVVRVHVHRLQASAHSFPGLRP